ncbi:SDR family NAD(P)-dependent oxidoreductase [Flavisphingomonas formosensis]|uniref:SDR family NAD(P)-dependent oxidoreductase n=1 Tax=Flavisphingomonas formosensis TaxID=861534 RepID=UPI0012F824CB|nr:SDR family NAD(P)-dependent oxidoreductase [Sphingomonas formosensis]
MAQGFGAKSTTDDVLSGVDLSGKRILVTGVSAGLGVETARALVAHGAQVIGAARNLAKARAVMAPVEAAARASGGSYELIELDLGSLASVRACADILMAQARLFDLIIANAGMMTAAHEVTCDGFEAQFGTNHLGHFLLINRLAPLVSPGGRVVSLASSSHYVSDIDLDDPNFEKPPYDPMTAYGRSKTANMLFAVEFDRRHRDRGVRATSVHPGGIKTGFQQHMRPGEFDEVIVQMNEELAAEGMPMFEFKSIPQGAATSVWAGVVAPAEMVGGRYCEDCHVSEFNDGLINAVIGGVRRYALDPERAKRLWTISEDLVGERF